MPKAPRLTKETWIAAGLQALIAEGHPALRAEYLCRRVGTTKGSFYWHFADIGAFHRAVLTHWQAAGIAAMHQAAERQPIPKEALRALGDGAAFWPDPACVEALAEPAIQAWAQGFDPAQLAFAAVYDARFAKVTDWLAALDLGNPDFAHLFLAARMGSLSLQAGNMPDPKRMVGTLTDLLLMLE